MLSTILYNKDIEKHNQNLKYYILPPIQKKYFLLCENCFWMASALRYTLNYPSNSYKRCPICKNKVDIFPIPNLY
jgi:hypothetical protein